MKLYLKTWRYLSVLFATTFLLFSNIFATPPPVGSTDETWSHPSDSRFPIRPPIDIHQLPRRDLDNYLGRFLMKCRFLDSMQESDPENQNFGGLHEGEGDDLWRIVESDNTQESIRVWCEHAVRFDDRNTYSNNVDAAWIYANNNPAWEESAPGEMYGLHNSGWGLIAEMRYRSAYENDDQREYGANCADLIIEHTPEITINMQDRLMPLVAGWAAGTLYLYGEFEDNADYREAALNIGTQVKNWIDADSTRLYANEVWALCGGTAMWGVLNTLGKADSAITAEWAERMLENMDVFAGQGQWNNSWNIWYAHAWIAAWKLTGSQQYRDFAETIVDSLLSQDGDHDGGIPATGGDGDDADQSWVSAYTAWMGLTSLFEILPEVNCRVVSLLEPSYSTPYPANEPIFFSFTAENGGYSDETETPIRLRGAFQEDSLVTISGWFPSGIHFMNPWLPEEPGEFDFLLFTDHDDDFDRSNDTLSFTLNILPRGAVNISCQTTESDGVECQFDFFNLDIDENTVYRSITTDPNTGLAEINLMQGNYNIVIVPEFPFARSIRQGVYVSPDYTTELDLVFEQPSVILVCNDIDTTYIHYYEEALEETGYLYNRWNCSDQGSLSESNDLFPTLIYFTGDRTEETVSFENAEQIERRLANGGSVFITGQNISDDNADTHFLEEVLHSRHVKDNMNRGQVTGVENDEMLGNTNMLIFGGQGAANQFSESGIIPLDNAIMSAIYSERPDTAAVVRWEEESGGRGVFFAFGFEAISGMGDSNSRNDVMSAVLSWLNTPVQSVKNAYREAVPGQSVLTPYPNPSNGSVQFILNGRFISPWQIIIYDQLGRLVRSLDGRNGDVVFWDALNTTGQAVPSGIYFARLVTGGGYTSGTCTKVLLLR